MTMKNRPKVLSEFDRDVSKTDLDKMPVGWYAAVEVNAAGKPITVIRVAADLDTVSVAAKRQMNPMVDIMIKTPAGLKSAGYLGESDNKDRREYEEEFSTATGELAIVDASLIKNLDTPLADEAIIISTKVKDAVFNIAVEYDDVVLRSISVSPKEENGQIVRREHGEHKEPEEELPSEPEVAKEPEPAPEPEAPSAPPSVEEGLAPLSHDSTHQRRLRKHMKPRSRRHMKSQDTYRRRDPVRKVMSRLKRPSRHQPQPEVDESADFIQKNIGKPVTAQMLEAISDKHLLIDALDVLFEMSFNNWDYCDGGVTNGSVMIENDGFRVSESGHLMLDEKPLMLNFDWLYTVREMVRGLEPKMTVEDIQEAINKIRNA